MSETASCREILAPYCVGLGLDIGFGGDAVVPHALTFDMPRPYTNVGGDRQILRGDATDLRMFCDQSLDFIYSAHLLEDWTYDDLVPLLAEWRRVLKPGGLLITNCPDQQRFLAHVERHRVATGENINNLAHKESDFSLHTFKHKALYEVGPWETAFEQPEHGVYSWLLVVKKV